MSVSDEIQKELIILDKEKKNFARRINYKINKFKALHEKVLNEEASEKEIAKFKKERDSNVQNEIKEDVVVNAPNPPTFSTVETPVEEDKGQETEEPLASEKSFEIAKDIMLEYDYFLENMWHPSVFDVIKIGDVFRIRKDGRVLSFYGSKYLTPVSYQSKNSEGQTVMKVSIAKIPS